MTLSADLIIVDLSNEGVITLELINVDNNNQLTLDLNLQTQWMVTINIYALEAVQLWQPELLQFEIYAVVKNAVTFHLE